jgi:hypothetical protein
MCLPFANVESSAACFAKDCASERLAKYHEKFNAVLLLLLLLLLCKVPRVH